MRKLRILHTADLHLDSAFEALSAGKAAERRAEQRELLTALADLSQREKVDMVLMSGDLFDSANTYYETGEELIRCLNNIPAPVFISPGNHDFYSERSPYARLKFPENVYVFRSHQIECVPMPGLGARVFGAAFTENHCEGLLEDFSAERQEPYFNIMCIHGELGNPDSPYNPISEEELKASGMDYVALGHIHKASGLRKAGNTWYSWPGCPEGRGFDETGEKTVSIIELEDDKCSLETFPISARRYEILNVDISGSDPLLAIHSNLPDDTVSDIYRIILKGEASEVPDLKDLHEKLSGMFFELQLRDETRLYRSVWERAGEDSLRGIFLQKLLKRMETARDEDERMQIEQAARWGLAAMDNAEEVAVHGD